MDHQIGLFQLVRDFTPTEFRNNILAHAELGVVFNLPTIITTSVETGNAPLFLSLGGGGGGDRTWCLY